MNPRSLAFWLTPVVLVALHVTAAAVSRSHGSGELGEEYFTRARKAIDAIPFRIGPWAGVDIEPTRAAVELLRPNRILQREYVGIDTGAEFTLMVVHCRDARDLAGHYPPRCYPANGWAPVSSTKGQLEHPGGGTIPTTVYLYRTPGGVESRVMRITNFFIIPGAGRNFAPTVEAVQRVSGSRLATVNGAAQVQVLAPDTYPAEVHEAILRDVLGAIAPAMDLIAKGDHDARDDH